MTWTACRNDRKRALFLRLVYKVLFDEPKSESTVHYVPYIPVKIRLFTGLPSFWVPSTPQNNASHTESLLTQFDQLFDRCKETNEISIHNF